uniref:Uncharacterized protein n=1 Tax=Setaria viridis TaxID=4556 RepID=A0A4U6VKK9_SETVI|nr:hypothetical protein SEVIR_3G375501v2 [Setaria viridis]
MWRWRRLLTWCGQLVMWRGRLAAAEFCGPFFLILAQHV